jgi:hypothetical protein
VRRERSSAVVSGTAAGGGFPTASRIRRSFGRSRLTTAWFRIPVAVLRESLANRGVFCVFGSGRATVPAVSCTERAHGSRGALAVATASGLRSLAKCCGVRRRACIPSGPREVQQRELLGSVGGISHSGSAASSSTCRSATPGSAAAASAAISPGSPTCLETYVRADAPSSRTTRKIVRRSPRARPVRLRPPAPAVLGGASGSSWARSRGGRGGGVCRRGRGARRRCRRD